MPADTTSILHSRKKFLSTILYTLVTSVLLGYSINVLGNIQYGSNDGSLIINAAWPLHLGQTAYFDVVSGMPPLLLLSTKWSFDIFGVKWSSIVNMTALMAAIFFILQTYIFIKNKIPPVFSILFSLYIQIVCWLPTSFLWHNGMTSASVALLISSVWFLHKYPENSSNYIFYSLSLFVTVQTKPNLAALSITFTFLYLLIFNRNQWHKTIGYALIASFLTYIFLTNFNNVSLLEILKTYKLFSNRVLLPNNLIRFGILNASWEKTVSYILLLFSIIAFLLFLRYDKKDSKLINESTYKNLFFFLIGVFVSTVGIFTNNDFKIQEITPITLCIFLILTSQDYHISTELTKPKSGLLFNSSIILFIAFGLGISITRIRIYEEGPDLFFQNTTLKQLKSPAFFEGVWAGPRFINTLEELQNFITEHKYTNNRYASVFFGPRLDFAYAAYGIEPRSGLCGGKPFAMMYHKPKKWSLILKDNITNI